VLDVALPEVILNKPRIGALVGERETTSMAEQVRMGAQGRDAAALYFARSRLTTEAVQRLPLFADKEGPPEPRAACRPVEARVIE
jgi:hypothetical protein